MTLEPGALVVRALSRRRIDLERLGVHRVVRGRLVLAAKGKRRLVGVSLRRVPNAPVLLDLLDRRADWQAAPGRRRGQRPKNALTKNQRLAGRSAIRRVR